MTKTTSPCGAGSREVWICGYLHKYNPLLTKRLPVHYMYKFDAWLPTHNDFLELVITNKMEEGEFVDVMNEIRNILEVDYIYEEDEDEDDLMEEGEPFYCERVKMESPPAENNANILLYAGYADCMEEAIRFLVEEENISPEHPVVLNLKAHLEKSKDQVLRTLCLGEEKLDEWKMCDNVGTESHLSNIFLETFQNCRDSG